MIKLLFFFLACIIFSAVVFASTPVKQDVFAVDDIVPEIVNNADFPGLAIPSFYNTENGKASPDKPVVIVEALWLFKGIAGKLSDKWLLITHHGGSWEFYPDVIGARHMIRDGGSIGIDVETEFYRIQGYPFDLSQIMN